MSLISPNFDVKSIIFFPILARGLFPKLVEKSPVLIKVCDLAHHVLFQFLMFKMTQGRGSREVIIAVISHCQQLGLPVDKLTENMPEIKLAS